MATLNKNKNTMGQDKSAGQPKEDLDDITEDANFETTENNTVPEDDNLETTEKSPAENDPKNKLPDKEDIEMREEVK